MGLQNCCYVCAVAWDFTRRRLPLPVLRERAGVRVLLRMAAPAIAERTLTLTLSRSTGRGDMSSPFSVVAFDVAESQMQAGQATNSPVPAPRRPAARRRRRS